MQGTILASRTLQGTIPASSAFHRSSRLGRPMLGTTRLVAAIHGDNSLVHCAMQHDYLKLAVQSWIRRLQQLE
jgi:hypothetical protein